MAPAALDTPQRWFAMALVVSVAVAVAVVGVVVVSVWFARQLLKFLKSLVRGRRGRFVGASMAA